MVTFILYKLLKYLIQIVSTILVPFYLIHSYAVRQKEYIRVEMDRAKPRRKKQR